MQQALSLMGQADTRITGTREICERTASAAVLEGSIASLGSQYVLGLRSRTIATAVGFAEQGHAATKEILNALERVPSKFRSRVGESLATVRRTQQAACRGDDPIAGSA